MRGSSRGRTWIWTAACLLAVALTVALASCGGDSPEATAQSKPEAAAKTGAPATSDPCATQLAGLLKALDGLRTALFPTPDDPGVLLGAAELRRRLEAELELGA